MYTSYYLRYVRRKQIATVVLQLQCLVLPIICIALVLLLGNATGGARVLIWTRWGLRWQLVATWADFQHSMVYYATNQCGKRLEACINAEGDHSEHLLWHCLPDIPLATHHNRFFSEPLTTTHNWLLIVYAKQKAFGAIRSITVPRKTVSNFALCSSNSTCEATN